MPPRKVDGPCNNCTAGRVRPPHRAALPHRRRMDRQGGDPHFSPAASAVRREPRRRISTASGTRGGGGRGCVGPAATDVGDWFRFEIGGGNADGRPRRPGFGSTRSSVPRPGSSFTSTSSGRIVRMTGQPEDVPAPGARGDPGGGTAGLPGLSARGPWSPTRSPRPTDAARAGPATVDSLPRPCGIWSRSSPARRSCGGPGGGTAIGVRTTGAEAARPISTSRTVRCGKRGTRRRHVVPYSTPPALSRRGARRGPPVHPIPLLNGTAVGSWDRQSGTWVES